MKEDHLRLSKETAVYSLGGILASAFTFLLVPFFGHALTASDYGVLSLYVLVQSVMEIVATFGVSSATWASRIGPSSPT